jgi:hypothetical protein
MPYRSQGSVSRLRRLFCRISSGARPAWQVLRYGFLGTPVGNGQHWDLGTTLPGGPTGGPVFDAAGSLTGIAVSNPRGAPMFLPVSRLKRTLGASLAPVAPPLTGPQIAIEVVCENAMRTTLQVLTAR